MAGISIWEIAVYEGVSTFVGGLRAMFVAAFAGLLAYGVSEIVLRARRGGHSGS